jgi:asparagine synthase (glutamine-hydrolysing)
MSGFLGIFHRDGKPIDHNLLSRLKQKLTYRGPDAQQTWQSGNVGLVHTLFRTTWEQRNEQQPFTLGNQRWLVGEIRLDRREELIAKIGEPGLEEVPDCELVLHAYIKWGEACVEHLAGDFAFGIWDSAEQKMFCARDHFGIRQLYYYETAGIFVFSNDLDRLLETGAPKDVNDQALVDFLIFGHNRVPGSTSYHAIQRLPAAHTASVSATRSEITRYWKPPELDVRYKRKSEYVEHFRELLLRAVSDRLRIDRVSLLMSGGLDSTSIAAFAQRGQCQHSRSSELKAFTVFEEILGEDPERRYSTIASRWLGIPHQLLDIGNFTFFQDAETILSRYPQPYDVPFGAVQKYLYAHAAAFGRVGLNGCGADPSLQPTHTDEPFRTALVFNLIGAFPRLLLAHRRIPRLGFRTALRRAMGKRVSLPPPPDEWLLPQYRHDESFQQRRQTVFAKRQGVRRLPAFDLTMDPLWAGLFEYIQMDGAEAGLEVRFPFFAIDVIGFVLNLPSLPWFVEKHLLREATKGWLPKEIRLRPKTYVQHTSWQARASDVERFVHQYRPSDRLQSFIAWKGLLQFSRNTRYLSDGVRQAISMDFWLMARGLT